VSEQVKQGAQQVAEQTQEAAGQAIDVARTQATSMLDSQKGRAVDNLSQISQALQSTQQQLQQNGQSVPASAVGALAGRLDGATGYLQNHNVRDIVWDVEDLASRNPWAFVGGAFALGLAAARFLKSSPQSSGRAGAGQSGPAHNYRGGGSITGGSRYAGRDRSGYRQGDRAMASGGDMGYGYLSSPSDTPAPYDMANPPEARENVRGAPDIQIGYARGLTGENEGSKRNASNT
jgi:hypothetical protein